MDDLIRVKQVVVDLLSDLTKDRRAHFKLSLANMFRIPLISFNDAYNDLIAAVGTNSDSYDCWLSLQMQMWTELGPDRIALIKAFTDMFDKIIKETPGGQAFIKHEESNKFSHTAALIFRVYTATVFIEGLEEPSGENTEGGEGGDKQ